VNSPGFEHDIFISYSHADNRPLTQGQKGWIDDFHRALETRLAALLGSNARLWRDPKLHGNDYFEDVLPDKLRKTAILVSVLSPQYMNSEWCMKELDLFCQAAEASGGVRVGDQSRIFKVLKLPVDRDKTPASMRGLLGYEFFEPDPQSGAPKEFSPEFGHDAELHFVQRVNDLAFHLRQLIELLRPAVEASAVRAAPPSGTTIYLAETSYDAQAERDQIKRELEQRGHRVLPDRSLPLNAQDFRRVVGEQLAQSQLSVHLVGANYGIVPEGESESIVSLQHALALSRRGSDAGRIIWMRPGLAGSDDRQQKFVDYLKSDADVQQGAELLQTSVEQLKTTINDTLERERQRKVAPAPQPAASAGPGRVYLICDQQDRDATAPIADDLFNQGVEVTLPAVEGDEAEIRLDHNQNLLLCDAALIYVGRSSELWLRAQLRELLKAPGYGRTQPFAAKAIVLGPPDASWKPKFRTHDAAVLLQTGDFAPEVLAPFVGELRKRGLCQ